MYRGKKGYDKGTQANQDRSRQTMAQGRGWQKNQPLNPLVLAYAQIMALPRRKQAAALALLLLAGGTAYYFYNQSESQRAILTDPGRMTHLYPPCTVSRASQRLFADVPRLPGKQAKKPVALPKVTARVTPPSPETEPKASSVAAESASSPVSSSSLPSASSSVESVISAETSAELRERLAAKIVIDTSGGGDATYMQGIKDNYIDYFMNTCDEQLLYLVNTPVKLILTHHVTLEGDNDITRDGDTALYYSGYSAVKHEIRIFVPNPSKIYAEVPHNPALFNWLLRSIRHEQFHAIRAASAADASCRPDLATAPVGGLPLEQVDAIAAAIQQGDDRIIHGLGALVQKRNAGTLSHVEQLELARLTQLLQHYVLRSNVMLNTEAPPPAVIQQLRDGKLFKISEPAKNLTLYLYQIHAEQDPSTGKTLYMGLGYHVPDPEDKLAAIVADTQWKKNRIAKMPHYAHRTAQSRHPKAKITSEYEAFTVEMGPEVMNEFYPELKALQDRYFQQSACQPTSSPVVASSVPAMRF